MLRFLYCLYFVWFVFLGYIAIVLIWNRPTFYLPVLFFGWLLYAATTERR
jgi:hypothetical protein